jgi:hypothetical protein
MPAFPHGLIPVADAVCRFNPVYGQGMSVAALEALELQRLTSAGHEEALAVAFFQATQPTLETAWLTAAASDFFFPTTRGERPQGLDAHLALSAAVGPLAAADPAIHRLMVEVRGFLRPPADLRAAAAHALGAVAAG